MNHKEKLMEVYSQCIKGNIQVSLPQNVVTHLDVIGNYIESQKGVFTVLITLSIHKSLFPEQDIRYHQDNMTGGFSGRSVDTRFITPTLKELRLPSMSESGWLTRSLEQPYPYTRDYEGKISNKSVRESFLELVDFVNTNQDKVDEIIYTLLKKSIEIRENNKVEIIPIENPDTITIESFINYISEYMYSTYQIPGGSKIPVIVFYSIYQVLINELKRYEGCKLKELGYHTTSDRTSKSSGDIEIYKDDVLLESLEIKFEIDVSSHMVNRALEKIYQYNPKRYYILSTSGISTDDYDEILEKINTLKLDHGCQLIVNGLIPTLKYYMRLINNIGDLLSNVTNNILSDSELKTEHKIKWKEIYEKLK
jgi:DNA (cytosine-5)-methyltransferase 1